MGIRWKRQDNRLSTQRGGRTAQDVCDDTSGEGQSGCPADKQPQGKEVGREGREAHREQITKRMPHALPYLHSRLGASTTPMFPLF